jgi:hypothetical protein
MEEPLCANSYVPFLLVTNGNFEANMFQMVVY